MQRRRTQIAGAAQRVLIAAAVGGMCARTIVSESRPDALAQGRRVDARACTLIPPLLRLRGGVDGADAGASADACAGGGASSGAATNLAPTPLAGRITPRVLVCVLPQGTQLANGLRHLCSCFVLARHSNRELRIDPTLSMCASFFQLLLSSAAAPRPTDAAAWPAAVSLGAGDQAAQRTGRAATGVIKSSLQIPMVREPEWREHLVAEEAAYAFVLRQHPWTNWHPLVEVILLLPPPLFHFLFLCSRFSLHTTSGIFSARFLFDARTKEAWKHNAAQMGRACATSRNWSRGPA